MADLRPFSGELDPAPSSGAPAAAAPALKPFDGKLDEPAPAVAVNPVAGFAAGLARGAKDVIDTGAQLLASGFDKIAGTTEGERVAALNAEGKAEFDANYKGSTAADIGRVGGQIAATLPVGGALGAGVRAAGVAGLAPRAAVPLGEAIASGGLRAEGAGVLTRAAGGAIAGGATAGLADPDTAAAGAAIGAALPVVVRGAANVGFAAQRALRGPEVPPGVRAAAAAGLEAGYVVPPAQVAPTATNRFLESMAGKLTTAQNASAMNQGITNELAKRAIGATELTAEGLAAVRKGANEAYNLLGQSAPFQADDAFRGALEKATGNAKQTAKDFPELRNTEVEALVDGLAQRPEFGAQPTIEAIKQLRFNGSSNKASLDPTKKALGSVQMKVAGALEDLIDRNLEKAGQRELLAGYREARTTLAKTYDIEKALNPTTGNVDAAKLAQILKKGRPLTGELKQAAEFAGAFPKAVQLPERMGSLPQNSPLDWMAAGGLSAATGSPLGMIALGARPLARAAALSKPLQRELVREQVDTAPRLGAIRQRDGVEVLARTAPVGLTNRDR